MMLAPGPHTQPPGPQRAGSRLAPRTEPPLLLVRAWQLEAAWARHADDVREARELRRRVGAGLPDDDLLDPCAEHLLVRARDVDGDSRTVGSLRVLTPAGANRAGGLELERAFDTVRLRGRAGRTAELGALCVDPAAGEGTVFDLVWFALAGFMRQRSLDLAVGAFTLTARDGGQTASALFRTLAPARLVPIEWRVTPRHPVALDERRRSLPATPSAQVARCLDGGARLLGAPGWDPATGQPCLPYLLSLPAASRLD